MDIKQMMQVYNDVANTMQSHAMLATIVSGVIVFVICEYLKEIWLSPLQEYKKLKQRISYALTYYANVYCNVIDPAIKDQDLILRYNTTSDKLRDLASELRAFSEILSWLRVGIPSKKKIYKASCSLMGLSNSLFCPKNSDNTYERIDSNENRAKKIRNLLGIYNGDEIHR